mgnify:FL=1
MYLMSFELNGVEDWGLVSPERGIVCPSSQWKGDKGWNSLLDFIKAEGIEGIEKIKNIEFDNGVSLDAVKILAPIAKPSRNIICVGKNYMDHIQELSSDEDSNAQALEHPRFFTKATNTVIGPFDPIPLHKGITEQVDYEAELAVIIGKRGANISEEEAMEYVFGYTILNDVTARDLQRNHGQWFKGKSLDGFCPMGPWIVTWDEIPEPVELEISSYVNGEQRQKANTRMMIYKIPRLISIISQGFTLEPGDIIATGTPSGVGMGFDPPKLLKANDRIRVEIEKIGYIENIVQE